jgi:tRNA(His) 5'-end guanylyltransferase
MRFGELEAAQRTRERYHDLSVPVDQWIVVRVDGRSFTTLTNAHFTKPFDDRFGELMAVTAAALLQEFAGLYVYTQSDEISLLLPRATGAFGRRVEKLVSLSAATASAAFTAAAARRVSFDARIWTGDSVLDVVDYFAWRQADADRNALNTCLYWALREQGLTAPQAQRRMEGLDREAKKEAVATYGPAFGERPAWQRRGVGIWFETVEKRGYDPKAQRQTKVLRHRLHHEFHLPVGAGYRELVANLASGPSGPITPMA